MIHRRIILGAILIGLLAGALGVAQPEKAAEKTAEVSRPLIAIIPIRDEITDVTFHSLERRVASAREQGATHFVFEMDTPGGMVSSALSICTYIKQMKEPTLAWIRPDAYSAGAMISMACNAIVMSTRSKIGDCAPIMIDSSGGGVVSLGETERAKAVSPILEEFRDSARRNGYSAVLAEAMVKTGDAVYQIKKKDDSEARYVFARELDHYDLKVSDLIKNESKGDWKITAQVLGEGELLTLSQDHAVEYGIAKKVVADEKGLADFWKLPEADLLRLEITWSEELGAFLVSPMVRGLLMTVLMLAIYFELQAPGLGLAGAIALGALAILLGAPYVAGLAGALDIVLVLAGFALLGVELLLTPGMLLPGLLGLLMIVSGLLMTFVPSDPGSGWLPTVPGSWQMLNDGIKAVLFAIFATGVGVFILARYFGVIPVLKHLVLQTASTPMLNEEVRAGAWAPGVGQIGTAASMLRPVGLADFDNQRVDVQTAGEPIEAGRRIRVVQVSGNRIVVAEA